MVPVFLGVTVGASLLANASKKGLLRDGPDKQSLVEYAAQSPRECCAELNTIVAVLEKWPWMASDLRYSLYASDTEQGRLAAEVIDAVICRVAGKFDEKGKCKGSIKVIKGLGREEEFKESLLELAAVIKNDFAEARREGRLAYLIASGGFKPESTFAVLAAYLTGAVGVFYIHETFRKLVELPMIPLQLRGSVAEFASGKIDEHKLARELGLDVKHLEAVGLLEAVGGARRLNPLLEKLL